MIRVNDGRHKQGKGTPTDHKDLGGNRWLNCWYGNRAMRMKRKISHRPVC